MFSYSGPFRNIECPGGADCKLLNCIFAHNASKQSSEPAVVSSKSSGLPLRSETSDITEQPPLKRRRYSASIGQSADDQVGAIRDSHEHKALTGSSNGVSAATKDGKASRLDASSAKTIRPDHQIAHTHSSERAVSPPPLKRPHSNATKAAASPPTHGNIPLKRKRADVKEEILAPRIVPKPPTAHGMRSKLLALMHEQMSRLNKEVVESSDPWKEALTLSPSEIIQLALNEEERAAKSNAAVYANVLKLRIAALKKMKFDAWRAERVKQIENEHPDLLKKSSAESRISTGLTDREEILLLPSLVTPQDGLAKHGYVTSEISATALDEARKGVQASHGYEVCDRCGSRFQVFPGRREDGALTSGGTCLYHPGKPRRPLREAGAPVQPEKYTCCQSALGSKGCTTAQNHVFKASDPSRLALVLPFQRTPAIGTDPATTAVCFDCEMGYTTMGMELIRLTATAWPNEKELIDVLVRPIGEILDLNSTFSGVWPKDFTEALPYDSNVPQDAADPKLRIVSSPSEARDLLFDHLTTTTPLMGHALENDLNAARIIHPTIIDTVALYPHPRGLPIRHGLKYLVKKYLDKDIQMGGALGHDSKEDSRAAGELVRFKVKQKWDQMRRDGWTVGNGEFNPPNPK